MVNNETFSHYSVSGRPRIATIAEPIAWMLVILLSVGAPGAWGHGEDDTPQG